MTAKYFLTPSFANCDQRAHTYKLFIKSETDLMLNCNTTKKNTPARMSCSIHVREYCAQAPPQEMSPRLKSVPTSRSKRRSSCCSDTTSHRWIVGLVALAILARTWGGKSICVITDIQRIHLRSLHTCIRYLADKEQQVSMAGEVHGKKEKSQFLHHRDAAFMGQGKRQRFYFWDFFGCCGLCVQRGAGPFSCPPQTDQVLKVLEEGLREKLVSILEEIFRFLFQTYCMFYSCWE